MTEEQSLHMKILSGNQLKVIAMIAMTCDHVGKQILPQYEFLQIIGRLAFPIFAYMIAEGCRYTRDRKIHLLKIAALAFMCQVVYFVAERSLYQCILVTFTLSICMIYAIDHAGEVQKSQETSGREKYFACFGAVLVCGAVYFVSVLLPVLLERTTDFQIDYGIWGILLPVFVYFAPQRLKVPMTGAVLVPLCLQLGGIQWYCLAAVVLLALYSGRRGRMKMKNLFFAYYPLHLAVIFLISCFL